MGEESELAVVFREAVLCAEHWRKGDRSKPLSAYVDTPVLPDGIEGVVVDRLYTEICLIVQDCYDPKLNKEPLIYAVVRLAHAIGASLPDGYGKA